MAFKFKDLMVNVLPGEGAKAAGAACPTLSATPAGAAAAAAPGAAPGAPEAAAQAGFYPGFPGHCPTLSAPPTTALTPWLCPTLSATATWTMALCPTLSATVTALAGQCATLSAVTTGGFTLFAAGCPTLSAIPTGAAQAQSAESLDALRQQLQQAMAQLDQAAATSAAPEGGLPATVEEAEDLERRLKGALKELQDHKKTLGTGKAKK